jgi:ribosomal-protein-alanine N-acetyltransferase
MTPDPRPNGVRPANPPDLEAILTIAAASPQAPHWQPADYAPYITPDPHSTLLRTALIAVSADKILAFAAATLLQIAEENLCQLDSMAVHPDARRQGLGTALLRAILAWAAQNNARHLSLEVRAGNTAAIRLYHGLGLREEGRRPCYYTHPEEDALLLGMPITVEPPPGRFPL